MISIIICSINPDELEVISRNIRATVGVPFEIISFDNRSDARGICEIYNEGSRRANYNILCFVHEDISFKSQNWGITVSSIFEADPKLGLLGVAGGGYKSVVPSSWYNSDLEINGEFYCNLIQGFKYSDREDLVDYRNPRNEKLSRVASIDGCWMCTRKNIAEKYPFDEKLLKGFHGYDLDFSLAVNQEYTVAVTYEILLKHFSEGNFSATWAGEILKLHKKWSWMLPVNTDELPEASLRRNERRAFKAFFRRSLDAGDSYLKLMAIIWDSRYSRIVTPKVLFKIYLDLWRVKMERNHVRAGN